MKKRSGDESRFESEMLMQKPPLGTPLDWENPLNDGTVLALAMNEGHGDHLQDLSMNGNHGKLKNFAFPPTAASGWNPGQTGIGLNFDGGDDHITIPTNGNMPKFQQMSISCIFKTSANDAYLVAGSEYSGDGANRPYHIWITDVGGLYFTVNIGGTSYNVESAATYTDNKNHHVAGVYDGGCMYLYADGALVGSNDTMSGGIDTSTAALNIGGWGPTTYRMFNGPIDQPRIQSRAWSAKEVKDYAINPWQVYEQ